MRNNKNFSGECPVSTHAHSAQSCCCLSCQLLLDCWLLKVNGGVLPHSWDLTTCLSRSDIHLMYLPFSVFLTNLVWTLIPSIFFLNWKIITASPFLVLFSFFTAPVSAAAYSLFMLHHHNLCNIYLVKCANHWNLYAVKLLEIYEF